MTGETYRPDIDGLRAIAVVSVVLFHLELDAFSGGFVGVDVFFVISGFLITRLIRSQVLAGTFSFTDFYIRRQRRLFPALFVTLVLSFLVGFLVLSPESLAALACSSLTAIFASSNILFWLESGYFDADAITKPLLHTWSLAVEEQFYLAWPISLVLLLRWKKPVVLAIGATVVVLAALLATERVIDHDPEMAFYLTPFRIPEFALGSAAVWVCEHARLRSDLLREALAAAGLACIGFAVLTFDADTPFPGLSALIPCAGAALAIYAGQARRVGWLLRNPLSVGIGLISYSLYLVHWPSIVFYGTVTSPSFTHVERAGLLLFSLLLATGIYFCVERPFRIGKASPKKRSDGSFVFGSGLAAVALTLPVALVWFDGGAPWRVRPIAPPPELRHTVDRFKTRWTTAVRKFAMPGASLVGIGSKSATALNALIIGDSHANHLIPLADYIGQRHNITFTLTSYPGCPPIFGTHKVYGAAGLTRPSAKQINCRKQIENWAKLIGEIRFDYVVLASRWDWLVEPEEYGPYRMRRDLLVANADPQFDVNSSRTTFENFLASSVQTILETGARVILISQVPSPGRSLQSCVSQPIFSSWLLAFEENCSIVSRSEALARVDFTNRVMTRLAQREGVGILIPSRYLCSEPTPTCKAVDSGVSLYFDDNHLSSYGSIFLARAWENDADFPFRQSQ